MLENVFMLQELNLFQTKLMEILTVLLTYNILTLTKGQLVIEIVKARDACILLAGERPYREYPLDWVVRNLKQCGYRILSVGFFGNTVSKGYIQNQIRVGGKTLDFFIDVMQKQK